MRSRRKQKQRARHVEPASQLPEEVTIAGLECVQAANGGEYAYHVTLREFLPSIERDGLLPQEHESLEEPGIFFEPDEEGAAVYHEPPNTVMLRWPLSGTPRSSTPDGEYAWYETVPPHLIEKKVKGGWVTLVKPMAPNARAPMPHVRAAFDECFDAEQSELDNFCPEAEERQAEREWDMYYEKWLD